VSEYSAPDPTACPTCTTATAPLETVGFRLTRIGPTGAGTTTATGIVTSEGSVPGPNGALSGFPGIVGGPVTLALSRAGDVTLSFLPGTDVLRKIRRN
jgi:hypothetical protein